MRLLFILLLLSLNLSSQKRDLEYYLNQATNNSLLINTAKNDNKTIQLDLQSVKAMLSKPLIDIESNILFAPIISHENNTYKFNLISDDANMYNGYDLAYSDGGQYQAFLSLKQSLFRGKTYKKYIEQVGIQTKLNNNKIELSKHELKQLVSLQYMLCLMAKKQSEISKSLLDKLNKHLVRMQELVKENIYEQTDLMLMQIETENTNIEYKTFLMNYYENLFELNILCGIKDTNIVDIEDININIENKAVINSEFINRFKFDSLNVIANQSIFENKYRPQVDIFINTGMYAIYLPSINRFGFATGVNFSWNIFDGNQKKIQNQKSYIELQNIEFEKKNFIKQRDINKEKYLNKIHALDKQIEITQNQLDQYNKLIALYKIDLSKGKLSIMDLKNLIRDVSAKKQENLSLQIQEQMLIIYYNYWDY